VQRTPVAHQHACTVRDHGFRALLLGHGGSG
jgi:hypothetical protein